MLVKTETAFQVMHAGYKEPGNAARGERQEVRQPVIEPQCKGVAPAALVTHAQKARQPEWIDSHLRNLDVRQLHDAPGITQGLEQWLKQAGTGGRQTRGLVV